MEEWVLHSKNNRFVVITVQPVNIHDSLSGRVIIMTGNFWNSLALSFPTGKMAVDFFECFRGLCETAKTLL